MATTFSKRFEQLIWALLIILVAWKYRNKLKQRVCAVGDKKCADEYFSDSYAESRKKFLKYSNKIKNANTYNIPIYSNKDDKTLYTDITIVNEDSKSNHLLLHLSGVHGVEGYTGSAIQTSLLKHLSNPMRHNQFGTLTVDEDEQPIIVFVHALNPFGFAESRRSNEDNIDLNRNFKTYQEWHQFAENGPNAFGYDDLTNLFNPNFKLQAFSSLLFDFNIPFKFHKYFINLYHNFNFCSMFLRFPYFLYHFGLNKIKIALSVGQMHNAKGIQYVGGGKLANSHEKLKEFLSDKFKEHLEWKKQISKVTIIDVHSGDDSYGIDKLLTDKSEYAMKLKRLFLDYDEKDLIQSLDSKENCEDAQFLQGIYDNANGFTFGYVPFIASMMDNAEEADLLSFASEFGSNHMIETVGICQIMENAYFQEYNDYVEQTDVDEDIQKTIKAFVDKSQTWLKDVFYVQEPEWKKTVVQRGFRVFSRCLNR